MDPELIAQILMQRAREGNAAANAQAELVYRRNKLQGRHIEMPDDPVTAEAAAAALDAKRRKLLGYPAEGDMAAIAAQRELDRRRRILSLMRMPDDYLAPDNASLRPPALEGKPVPSLFPDRR